MGAAQQILDSDFCISSLSKIRTAENTNHSKSGRMAYLRRYVQDTKTKQKNLSNGKMTFWKKMILVERKQSIERLMGDYISDEGIFTSEKPDDEAKLFSMGSKIEEGRLSGKLNIEETSYLKRHVRKTKNVKQFFAKGGWNSWTKMLYLERLKETQLIYRSFLQGDYRPRG